ncbi:glutathione S-transferase [Pacificibacter maritimus]|uniref:Glutathione S-transferase n=1 Tax=Pacificibacter maritimus TaxID=762213 RepID=A0A3N4U6C7_9RHOB|nr:glutathione S-transferase family protein [Pacificibacter maritimus]RPE66326.1 glutathione S-transferase [Pacificibacter maritimus]
MTAKLYCFGESGNAYKAALTLTFCGVEWQPIYVDFFNGEARSDAYRALNLMGEVPYFIDGDVQLSQSGVIQQYAAEQSQKLCGADVTEAREIMRWVLWDNQKMSGLAGPTRFLNNFLPEAKRPQEVISFQIARLKGSLAILEQALAGRAWLVGNQMTIADTACCGYLFYDEPFGFTRKDYPNIDRWLSAISAQDGWAHPYDMMPGSPADRA